MTPTQAILTLREFLQVDNNGVLPALKEHCRQAIGVLEMAIEKPADQQPAAQEHTDQVASDQQPADQDTENS